ncbi:MAG TPA: hypothetical protein VMZ91_05630 [Candidatus Paceibacterota bacterium]|nr:hypothetical protein [Candidatus Paceibacterota bacterium]
MKHFLRYGTNAGQKYFHTDGLDSLYDAVVINANMIAFSPAALANFVVKKTTNKPFFIDPITHAFQHNQSFICDKSGSKIKKSISKLIDAYGEDLKNIVCKESEKDYLSKKRLYPSDINSRFIKSFTQNVLDFQKNVSKEKKVDEYKDYIDFANQEDPSLELETRLEPEFLVAPYFYLDDLAWLDNNIGMIEEAKKIEYEKDIFAQIVIDKTIIEKAAMGDDVHFNKIIKSYQECSADGFLVWIDDYSEHHEITENLNKYVEFLKGIKNGTNKKIYSLYGSYFSIMLTHPKIGVLDGVCHGLEYGEARAVVPVGGGIPTAKYYFYPLHKRIDEAEMFNFLTSEIVSNFCQDICDCTVCKTIMKNEDYIKRFNENFGNTEESRIKMRNGGFITRHYPSTKTKDNSLRHYLLMKYKEFNNVINLDNLDTIKDQLKNDYAKYKNSFNSSDTKHLIEWKKALDKCSNIDE